MDFNNDDQQDETARIREANSVTDYIEACKLQKSISVVGISLSVINLTSHGLSPPQKAAVFELLRTNMREYYDAEPTWKWNDAEKSRDLFHQNSKFFLCCDDSNAIVAFAMFRFEWDDEEEPEHPVLFCHEFQVDSRYWRKGLGRALMRLVVETARSTRMWKTMLTVFKRNQPAMDFYLHTGFKIDANSPSSCGHNSECYEILSCK